MNWFKPRYPTLRKAIINLKTNSSIRGVIWERKAGYLILRNAEILVSPSEGTAVDGEVLIPEGDIHFIQLLAV